MTKRRGFLTMTMIAVIAVVALACGETATVPNGVLTDAAVDGASTTDGGSSGTDGGSTLSAACPKGPPSDGATCSSPGLQCEYGDDPDLFCNTLATCGQAGWSVTRSQRNACPTQPPPAACPPSRNMVQAEGACGSDGLKCVYPEGRCTCRVHCGQDYPVSIPCEAGTPTTWDCTGAAAGCPLTRPKVGSACTMAGQQCAYGTCDDPFLVCQDGTWRSQITGCPVSTRTLKRDIRYLDQAAIDELAARTTRTKLATYAYVPGAGEPGQRLGFIIEDDPKSPAVLEGQNRVDLYAYTSMVVATVQKQSRDIARLEQQVRELRAALEASRRAAAKSVKPRSVTP